MHAKSPYSESSTAPPEWVGVVASQPGGVPNVCKSVLDAIREGDWLFEPKEVEPDRYQPTSAIPGTREKVAILAARVRAGLPLWHRADRADYDEPDNE